MQAGALDLKIDNTCYYNGQACTNGFWGGDNTEGNECTCTWESKDLGRGDVFFNLTDLKPGDWEEDTISVNVDNPSWLCADIKITRNADNNCTEPEQALDGGEGGACIATEGPGDLARELYFTFWKDDGDNVLEENEVNGILTQGSADSVLGNVKWALADSLHGSAIGPETFYIGKFFCFGTPAQDAVSQDGQGATGTNGPDSERGPGFTCDGSLVDNKSQTDSLEGDISFYAEQARHNDSFLCSRECEVVWAGSVESNTQGTRKDGTGVLASRTDPNQGLVAQTLGNPYDSPVVEGTFYSLGFNIGGPAGGEIVVEFNNPIFPVAGANNDIQVFEVTGGTFYPDEIVKVEAAQNAGGPWTLLSAAAIRDETLDISPLPWAKFIKITDISDIAGFESIADAYDLDGVKAFCGTSAPAD